uniref:Transposase Tc1-like domain-containing protein n=1 Tax=Micrurus carvalhoi TaxID=3147026 RepID=A0A2H6NH50_9SAUR
MTGSTLEDQESHQNGKIWLRNAFRWLTGSPHLKITRIWGKKCDVKVYTSTVRRRLLSRGLKGCRAQSKPLLTDAHHSHRRVWAKKYAKWTNEQWAKIIFRDKSNFYLTGNQCNKYVRRFPAEEFRPYCLNLSVKHPLHMMIWGYITASGIGRIQIVQGIMNSKRYVEVLEKTMLPSAQQLVKKGFYFQDDKVIKPSPSSSG